MRGFGPQRGHRGSEQADVAFANVSHESPDNIITEKDASRVGVYSFALLMFAAGFAAVFALSSPWLSVFTVLGSAAAGLLLASTLRVAAQWEHVALLRFGRFRKIAGPGVYVVVPFADSVAMHIDRRTITTAFYAEQALTSDLVSVDVDAILFWMVYDSEKACLEVANFPQAVRRAAQTAVRDAIGQVTLAELSVRRRQLDHELQEFMAEKCEGHQRHLRGDPQHQDPEGAAGLVGARGPGRARTRRPRAAGRRRARNLGDVRGGGTRVQRGAGRHAAARHEPFL